ncbi:MAG TPA: TIR domain-containing protein [Thermoanaerobaculia bacterium]|nr:TIR domain-containing protein [Thermoanaerobaculia bacterium]
MKVIISWSGEASHRVALVLRDWLPTVLQHVDPWVSSEDIPKGARWMAELASELETTHFGIICLVPGNLREPWVNFEAGAISRSINVSRVSPFLLGLDRSAVDGPLAQFQSTIFEKDDVRKLVHSINRSADTPIAADRVDRTFELCWPGLFQSLEGVVARPHEEPTAESRSDVTILSEKQIEILVFLANRPSDYPTLEEVAEQIQENVTRTRYYLDRLMDQELVDQILNMLEPTTYYLTGSGRAYVVERNLV